MPHDTGSFTGLNHMTIFTQQWFPENTPRAIVLLAHGYGEHSGRYGHVAQQLTLHGYAVCALDHRGHGRSEGPRVTITRFEDFVTDFSTYYQQILAEFPHLPVFAYGHSMGSLVVLDYLLQGFGVWRGRSSAASPWSPPASGARCSSWSPG